MPESPLRQKIDAARRIPGNASAANFAGARTVGELLEARAAARPDEAWLIYYDADGARSEYTYARFRSLVDRTAALLLAEGISRGDRVATVAHNHPDTVIQYFAAFQIGAVVVPINTGEDDRRIGYILANSGTKLAFVRGEYAPRIAEILSAIPGAPRTIVACDDPHVEGSFHRRLEGIAADTPTPSAAAPEDEALIV